MPRYLIAIDPGQTGSAAVFRDLELRWHTVFGWYEKKKLVRNPDWKSELWQACTLWRPEECAFEAVHAFPGQGVQSAFNFGVERGAAMTVIELAGVPVVEVQPLTWQRRLGLPRNDHIPEKHKRRAANRKAQENLALAWWPHLAAEKGDPYASALIGRARMMDLLSVPQGKLEA